MIDEMEDVDPWRRVVSEILRARRWKFWEEILFRFGSASGSGEVVGETKLGSNVTPGVCTDAGLPVSCAVGVSSEVGNVMGAAASGEVVEMGVESTGSEAGNAMAVAVVGVA